jgi:hypothetical protein
MIASKKSFLTLPCKNPFAAGRKGVLYFKNRILLLYRKKLINIV